ncbi:MAG TPA: hypothetical protein VHM65_02450, partial [Candidatus Lustribacter sp.]|nr:hypothetical protein [Candidatus Lustribacter sp.]
TSGGAAALDVLPSTQELIDYLCPDEDVPLSTAAHISARFPYVSPSGRITRGGRCAGTPGLVPGPAVSFDVDGGLFDNSGSGTVVDTWSALAPLAAQTEADQRACLVPIMVQVDNSPPAATQSSSVDARPKEPLAPVSALIGQVDSRERYSNARAAAAFSRPLSAGGQTVTVSGSPATTLYFRISLYGQPGGQPPLGWTLAPQTVKDMRSQLLASANADTIRAIRALLTPGTMACTPR